MFAVFIANRSRLPMAVATKGGRRFVLAVEPPVHEGATVQPHEVSAPDATRSHLITSPLSIIIFSSSIPRSRYPKYNYKTHYSSYQFN